MRVKILFNKKENALVQMSDSTQAQLGNTLHMCDSQVFKVQVLKELKCCCMSVAEMSKNMLFLHLLS